MSLLKLSMAWYQLSIIFLAPPQNFWCAQPRSWKGTEKEWRDMCSPKIEEHPCLIFDPDILISVPEIDRYQIPLVRCKEFVYDTTVFTRTIISDWGLVCSKHWLVHVCILFVLIKRGPLLAGIVVQCVASYATCVAPGYWTFLIIWFALAVASGGIGIISFVLCMEIVGGKWRTVIPIVYQLPFGLGSSAMAFLAYFLRDWRHLEFALATISSSYVVYYSLIDESPQWLLATGQAQRAYEILERAARQNKREEYFEKYKHIIAVSGNKKQKAPRFCTGLSFYTFSQYLGLIGSNIFLTVSFSGLISIPGGLICIYVILKVGRKTTVGTFQVVTTACFIILLVIPKDSSDNDWARLLVAGIGFAGLAGSVPALYLYSGELFPTRVRNVGVGGVTTFARVASMVAPIVVGLDEVMADLPLILLAVISLLQLVMLFPLPETRNQLLSN
ncbi:unnamed protein product [Leptidea sinapis]|uniref:Major facilitator superfamily (MFS) profile domain-containing protein n=1 Tax=Leptidea sinapis TaxID=189913 RepID=A0A5E4QQ95_9NEOP|nr:unnamed protein product [Leptidea sinapis]